MIYWNSVMWINDSCSVKTRRFMFYVKASLQICVSVSLFMFSFCVLNPGSHSFLKHKWMLNEASSAKTASAGLFLLLYVCSKQEIDLVSLSLNLVWREFNVKRFLCIFGIQESLKHLSLFLFLESWFQMNQRWTVWTRSYLFTAILMLQFWRDFTKPPT